MSAIQRAVALIDADVDENMTEPLVELDRWVTDLAARKQIPFAERAPLRAKIAKQLTKVDTAAKGITRVVDEPGRSGVGKPRRGTAGHGRAAGGHELDTVAAHQRVWGWRPRWPTS